jgi:hypothetical protein
MATNLDPLNDFCWMKDGPIPPVDPADLKSVWAMQKEFKKDFEKRMPDHAPNETVGVGIDYYRRVCGPGANVGAVWYRLSRLEALQMMSEAGGQSWAGLTEGKPDDAVFKALANLSMTGMQPGVIREGLPFDVEQLIRLIREEE